MHNTGGTVGNSVFYGGQCQGVIRRTPEKRISSWKGDAIQGALEHR
jgi:hypothetical protein